MTFDQTMFVWCVIVPGSIAAAAIGLTPRVPIRFRGLAVAFGWWCAVVAAMVGLHGWQWWPDEFWRQSIWPILAWAVCFSGAASQQSDGDSWRSDSASRMAGRWESGRWVLAGTLACVTAVVAIPSGEPWSDTFHLHRIWVAAVATSCLLNSFSIDCMSRSGAERWSLLVALAALGGPMALAASCYGSLAQWTLAAIVATSVVALVGVAWASTHATAVAFPVLATAASITAAGRFHTYTEHPGWIYALMLYGTTLVATVDYCIRGGPTWLRVTASAIVSAALVGLSAAFVLMS